MSYDGTQRKILLLLPAYGWLIVFTFLPFLLVCAISFSPLTEGVPPYTLFFGIDPQTHQFHFIPFLENYRLIFTDALYSHAYFVSLQYAAIATVLALFIAYPIAYGIAHAPTNMRNVLLTFIIIPFWTSLLIRVYAWVTLLKNNGLINNWLMEAGLIHDPISIINTPTAVIIGIVYSYLPFMILPLYSALEKIPPVLLEAAEDLGCRPFNAFLRVTLPLSLPGVIAGSMLVFIPAIGEFVIPDLLGGSRILTIGKVLWNEFFSNRDWPTAAAVTVLMTLILVIPIMMVQSILGKKEAN